jgi:hypothetical protein
MRSFRNGGHLAHGSYGLARAHLVKFQNLESKGMRVSGVRGRRNVLKFVTHSATVLDIAMQQGWLPGARYTNLRDVKRFPRLGFLDINWKNYDFSRHLEAAKLTKPLITVSQNDAYRPYVVGHRKERARQVPAISHALRCGSQFSNGQSLTTRRLKSLTMIRSLCPQRSQLRRARRHESRIAARAAGRGPSARGYPQCASHA